IVSGSTTAIGSEADPIFAVLDGWSAVSASFATHSKISSSVSTEGPGEISPALYGSNDGCDKICREMRIASTHSRRSFSVERYLIMLLGCCKGYRDSIFTLLLDYVYLRTN